MAYDSAFARIIAPANSEHVAINFGDYCFKPAVFRALLGDDQIAEADLLPSLGQVGRRTPRRLCPRGSRGSGCRRACWMSVSVRSGRDQLVLEVTSNERYERAAGRVNPANRQPSGKFGNLWVIAAATGLQL
jgi:hypothetical protein